MLKNAGYDWKVTRFCRMENGMAAEESKKIDKIYHPPELIVGKWYHMVEVVGPDGGVKCHGPFQSKEAAYAHREKMMRESGDVAASNIASPPEHNPSDL